jgi:hypothetical protein
MAFSLPFGRGQAYFFNTKYFTPQQYIAKQAIK